MKNTTLRGTFWLATCVMTLTVSGCGGGSGSSSMVSGGPGSANGGSGASYSVGGTVSGLGSYESVTLVNNLGDPLIVSGDGTFSFATPLISGSVYDVTVQSHTPGIYCTVSNGTGTISSSNVIGVGVSCATGKEAVLHSFGSGTDGQGPYTDLVMDSRGNLYGTTSGGGEGYGTVFKISLTGNETGNESVLYYFLGGPDGMSPEAGLLMDSAGNLYGTASGAGAYYAGTVFKISPSGTETTLYSFNGGATDGAGPDADLLIDGSGNLYGTTAAGGPYSLGTVFELSPTGKETVLHFFSGNPDGRNPQAGLVIDSAGNLYGTTAYGGANGYGTVFKVDAAGTATVLHSFGTGTDGSVPDATLIMDSAGNLYGTTTGGGADNDGTVFKISLTGAETVLYSFVGGTTDGANPNGGLLMDGYGNLFGTTYHGGGSGYGTVFKMTPTGQESVLYSFGTTPDAQNPGKRLITDSGGNLYGTTMSGGGYGVGTVFEIN